MSDKPERRWTDEDRTRAMGILEKYEDLDFVKRIFSPEKYPKITWQNDSRLKRGQFASHQMSWGQNGPDGEATEYYVYPNIVHQDGALEWLEPDAAHKYAVDSGERIVFDNKDDAMWFSEAYKSIWPEK
jgi:hypothetical protein